MSKGRWVDVGTVKQWVPEPQNNGGGLVGAAVVVFIIIALISQCSGG